jgi:hypothetical protein
MATLGATYLTLIDLFKQQEGDGKVTAQIIEMLAETNQILDDMVVMPCNNGTKHLTTSRTGLPAGTWRRLYQGVQPTKSEVRQVTDTTGMLESWSEVDSKLVSLSANPGQFRMNESAAFIEGMSNDMASTIFYGNTDTDPEQFMGLAPRFNSLSAENGSQIVDAGGSGADNTSIWFVVWGERTAHGIYPASETAGLGREDKGKVTKTNSDGSLLDVHREKFTWDLGMSVRDWRYVSRIANIDVSLALAGSTQLYDFMRSAYYNLQQRRVTGGRAAIYCNTDMLEALDLLASNQGSADSYVRLTRGQLDGKEVVSYRGIPIRECDAILNTEALVA